jgi:hypothetical protein
MFRERRIRGQGLGVRTFQTRDVGCDLHACSAGVLVGRGDDGTVGSGVGGTGDCSGDSSSGDCSGIGGTGDCSSDRSGIGGTGDCSGDSCSDCSTGR